MLNKVALPDGFAITPELLDEAETFFGVKARRGDFLLVRTGNMEEKLSAGSWDGYPGGDAPGLAFATLDWLHARKWPQSATDTFAVEVRPNEIQDVVSPFHWISIPIMGLTLGEIFFLRTSRWIVPRTIVTSSCFVAPTLPITALWHPNKSIGD